MIKIKLPKTKPPTKPQWTKNQNCHKQVSVNKSLNTWQQVDNSLPRKLNKGLLTCQQGKSPNKTQ